MKTACVFCTTAAILIPLAMGQPSPSEECRRLLDGALHEKNPDTRKLAVVALSLTGSKQPFLSMLIGALDDKDVEVRLAAVASLSDFSGQQSTAALKKALADDVPEVSFAAAKALWARQDPAGRQALLSVLSGDTRTASGFITKQKRDALRMTHTPRTMFLFAVREGVGFAPVPGLGTGIASMQALLSDPGMSGRATAALLLGKDKDRATLDALHDALAAKEWAVRAAAVHSIAVRDDADLKEDVFALIGDRSQAVRLRAAAAWLRLDQIRTAQKKKRRKA